MAFCLTRTGQYAQAAQVLKKLGDDGLMSRSLVEAETKAILALGQARGYARAARYRDAAQTLAPVADQTCPVTQAHLDAAVALGDAYFALSQFEPAAAAYARAEASGQKWAYGQAALIKHVRSLIECGRPGEAVALVEKHTAAPMDPMATDLRRAAADAYLAHAAALLAQSGQLSPIGRHVMASKVLGTAYARLLGEANAAPVDKPTQRVADRVRATQTALAKLWLAAGKAALAKNNTARATECFWRITKECPRADAPTRFNAAKAQSPLQNAAREEVAAVFTNLLSKNDHAAAAPKLHDIAGRYPFTRAGMQAAYYEGKCLREMGKHAQAKAIFERHLRRYPDSSMAPTVCYMIGQCQVAANRPREALEAYAYALKAKPDAPNADMCAYLIAVYYWQKKDYTRCARACQTLLRQYPKSKLSPRAKAMSDFIRRKERPRSAAGRKR